MSDVPTESSNVDVAHNSQTTTSCRLSFCICIVYVYSANFKQWVVMGLEEGFRTILHFNTSFAMQCMNVLNGIELFNSDLNGIAS